MDWKQKPLEELELTIRTWNCLKNQGFKTVGDVLEWDEAELLRIPNFGRKSLNELKEIVGSMGLRIAGQSARYLAMTIKSETYEKIAASALANGRSVEAEAKALLSNAVGVQPTGVSIVDRIERLERAVFREPSQ